jgi:hypothetical protein
VNWKYETQDRVHCSPAIRDGKTFTAGCDGMLRIIDVATGKEAATIPLGDYVAATPSVAGDRIYVGTVDPPLNRRELESRIREGVGRCYDAVRSKNVDRLASLYHPETVADEEKLKRLSRILRTVPWQAAVGKRVDGAREMSARTAAAEFSFRLTWRDAFGGRLFSQPIFRAEFALDGDTWAMSSCRIVGSPKL